MSCAISLETWISRQNNFSLNSSYLKTIYFNSFSMRVHDDSNKRLNVKIVSGLLSVGRRYGKGKSFNFFFLKKTVRMLYVRNPKSHFGVSAFLMSSFLNLRTRITVDAIDAFPRPLESKDRFVFFCFSNSFPVLFNLVRRCFKEVLQIDLSLQKRISEHQIAHFIA